MNKLFRPGEWFLPRPAGWFLLGVALISGVIGWWWLAAVNAVIGLTYLAEGYNITSVLGLRLWWVKNDDA